MKKIASFMPIVAAVLSLISIFLLFLPSFFVEGFATEMSFSGYECIFGGQSSLAASPLLIVGFVVLIFALISTGIIILINFLPSLAGGASQDDKKLSILSFINAALFIAVGVIFLCFTNLLVPVKSFYSDLVGLLASSKVGAGMIVSGILIICSGACLAFQGVCGLLFKK